ncbi:Hypothetical predicted protein [Cloeon dipterum]|uniref:Uncharacterized protein n=1 Tax=Cloeon dipterum TaxID=197152 RepID=A0A8S1D8Q1_9INSE|nr:Hypothetical predicted protein [Cloeon dipterum]
MSIFGIMRNLRATVREKKVVGYAVKPGEVNTHSCLPQTLALTLSLAIRWAATSRRDDSSFCPELWLTGAFTPLLPSPLLQSPGREKWRVDYCCSGDLPLRWRPCVPGCSVEGFLIKKIDVDSTPDQMPLQNF